MPGSGNNGTVRTLSTGCSVRSGDVYRRYVSGLYRQALLTLGDSALAVRVVSDVIADECALAPARGRGENDVRHRLAESVFPALPAAGLRPGTARHGGPLAHGIAQAGNLIGHRCRNSRGTGER
jgi:hypothetical protein